MGGAPRQGHPGGWIARHPKSRFFKTDQTPLELGKCLGLGSCKGLGTGKYRDMGKGKDTEQVGRTTHSRRRAKRGGGYFLAAIDQQVKSYHSSLSKSYSNMKHISMRNIQFSNEIIYFLARIDQQAEIDHSRLSKHYSNIKRYSGKSYIFK